MSSFLGIFCRRCSPASLMVPLSELDPAEGFAIAERFDWPTMQKVIGKLSRPHDRGCPNRKNVTIE